MRVFASDIGEQKPESGVFAELLNIGAVCGEHFYRATLCVARYLLS